eukprot:323760-Pelagomonas_calceolata.AAC.6
MRSKLARQNKTLPVPFIPKSTHTETLSHQVDEAESPTCALRVSMVTSAAQRKGVHIHSSISER